MTKPKRDWAWKRFTEAAGEKKRSTNYRRPDYMINAQGRTVRFHVTHAIVPAIERFMAFVEIVSGADDLDCWQWLGSDTFRVDEETVTTPARFIWRETTGKMLSDREALYQTCKTPWCCRLAHREKRRVKWPCPFGHESLDLSYALSAYLFRHHARSPKRHTFFDIDRQC
jgi:hypothetical protein